MIMEIDRLCACIGEKRLLTNKINKKRVLVDIKTHKMYEYLILLRKRFK